MFFFMFFIFIFLVGYDFSCLRSLAMLDTSRPQGKKSCTCQAPASELGDADDW